MSDAIPMPAIEAIELDARTKAPWPRVQTISAEAALDALATGVCDSIMWKASDHMIAHRERMHPGSRTLYVACDHPENLEPPAEPVPQVTAEQQARMDRLDRLPAPVVVPHTAAGPVVIDGGEPRVY